MTARYAALGDSMSIDYYAGGPGRGAASLLYRNHDDDFPDWAGHDLVHAGFVAQNLARDGATVADVLDDQLPHLDGAPTLVTVTMGGNDLLTAYGDRAAAEATIARVSALGDAVLRRLRTIAGDSASIVVSTVYDPSDGTGDAGPNGPPPWLEGSALVGVLNEALRDLAERYGAVVADVHARFLGHGVRAGDPAQPEPRPANRELWYCGVIEPNAWGAHEIRAAWWHTLREAGWPAA